MYGKKAANFWVGSGENEIPSDIILEKDEKVL